MRWLDQRFEPILAAIPPSLIGKLQAAEIYHQLLEHRWFESQRLERDVSMDEALATYIPDVLAPARDEHLDLGTPTAELFLGDLSAPRRGLTRPTPDVAATPRYHGIGPLVVLGGRRRLR